MNADLGIRMKAPPHVGGFIKIQKGSVPFSSFLLTCSPELTSFES